MFCIVVQPGPARAQSHMTCCQVPEKSNNVWNSLIRYAWLQLQPLGLQRKFLLIEAPWHKRGRRGLQRHWVRHRGPGINMPMHTQACTHTRTHTMFGYVHVIHIQLNMICKCTHTKGQRSSVKLGETWEHWPLLRHHFPAEKNRKK